MMEHDVQTSGGGHHLIIDTIGTIAASVLAFVAVAVESATPDVQASLPWLAMISLLLAIARHLWAFWLRRP